VGSVKVGFEYRPYAGFVENLYSTVWETTQFVEVSKEGDFSIELKDLKKEIQYEFRAVVLHHRMKIYGDLKRF
jgi:hypothetical protein